MAEQGPELSDPQTYPAAYSRCSSQLTIDLFQVDRKFYPGPEITFPTDTGTFPPESSLSIKRPFPMKYHLIEKSPKNSNYIVKP